MLRGTTNLMAFGRQVLRQYRGRSYSKQVVWSSIRKYNEKCKNYLKRTFKLSATEAAQVDEIKSRGSYSNPDYELICPITEPYFEQVLTHARNNFFVEEPTSQMLNVANRGRPVPEMEEPLIAALYESMSVLYIHVPTNQVAAISINSDFKWADLEKEKCGRINNEDIRMIAVLFADIHRCINIFKKYDVQRIFDIKAVSVDVNHRQRGLAQAVIQMSLEMAEESGYSVVKTEGTSLYTQRAFLKCGFDTIWERNYSAFICENGTPVFQPIDPHKTLKIMTKVLNKR